MGLPPAVAVVSLSLSLSSTRHEEFDRRFSDYPRRESRQLTKLHHNEAISCSGHARETDAKLGNARDIVSHESETLRGVSHVPETEQSFEVRATGTHRAAASAAGNGR
jgi:hypothetical protein